MRQPKVRGLQTHLQVATIVGGSNCSCDIIVTYSCCCCSLKVEMKDKQGFHVVDQDDWKVHKQGLVHGYAQAAAMRLVGVHISFYYCTYSISDFCSIHAPAGRNQAG